MFLEFFPIFSFKLTNNYLFFLKSQRWSLNTRIHRAEFFRNLVKNDWSSAIGNVFLIGYVCTSRAEGSYDRFAGYFYSLTNLSMFREKEQ